LEDARKAYEKAIKLDPGLWIAHRGLGQALVQLGDGPAAVPALERAVALRPDDGASHAALARAYLLTGQRERADSAAARSRELEQIHTIPDQALVEIGTAGVSSITCFKRARELIAMERWQEAIQNLKVTEEVQKNNAAVHLSLGTCYEKLGKQDLAIQHYEKSLTIEENREVRVRAGMLQAAGREFEGAIAHYQKALAIAEDPSTRAELAAAFAQKGDLPAALQEFERAERAGPLNATAHNNWGSAFAQMGSYSKAAEHFQEAARLDPNWGMAHFNWGRALEDGGHLGEAIHRYEVAAQLDPRGLAARRIQELTASGKR
jgi:tetratricopeptide (TPR) repeat protein